MKLFRGLLLSCHRNFERQCMSEILYTLVEKLEFNRSMLRVYRTGISGLVSLKFQDKVEVNLEEIVDKLKGLEKDETFYVYCLKIKPIQQVIEADYEEMKMVIPALVSQVEGSYRIKISKRHTEMRSAILIDAAASVITNKVDLVTYRWQFLIEIIGDLMGLSAIKRNSVYSTNKSKLMIEDNWYLR